MYVAHGCIVMPARSKSDVTRQTNQPGNVKRYTTATSMHRISPPLDSSIPRRDDEEYKRTSEANMHGSLMLMVVVTLTP